MGSLRFLVRVPLFNRLCLATALSNLALYSLLSWAPSLALRTYGLGTGTVGLVMGVLGGGVTAIGIVGTGWLADRMIRRSTAAPLLLVAGGSLILAILLPVCILAPGFPLFAIAFALCYAVGASYSAPSIAAVQAAVPPELRATASAILLMLGTLSGLGLGPLMVGGLSDWLVPSHGAQSLRYALLILCPIALASAALYLEAALYQRRHAA